MQTYQMMVGNAGERKGHYTICGGHARKQRNSGAPYIGKCKKKKKKN